MTDTGTMTQDGDVATIEFSRHFDADPQRVWTALTDPDQLAAWLTEGSIGEGKGAAVRLDFDEGGVVTGEVTEWDPPKLLSFGWVFPDGVESVVTFELSSHGDGTMLRLIHERVPAQTAMGYTPGWHAFLDRLEAKVTGAEIPTWDERFAVVGPLYQ